MTIQIKNNIQKISKGNPKIAFIACTHGDELNGPKIIKELKKIKLKKGSLYFIIANLPAFKKKKRFIQKDLNRSFPGKKNGLLEEQLAYQLNRIIKQFDLVIDLHSTKSEFKNLIIITKINQKIKDLLKKIPIKKVALLKKSVFGGNDLISQAKLGLALEYGFFKNGKNYQEGLNDIKQLLINLNIIDGIKKEYPRKDFYIVYSIYKIPPNFKPKKTLKEFCLIKKNEIIGYLNNKKIKAKYSFYPLFLGKGKYPQTLSLISRKEKLNL